MKLNVAHMISGSYIYAPGNQFVIWVQGCSLRCQGCWNTAMWDFIPQNLISVEDLFNTIIRIDGIDGVTFLGGEPFDQPEALHELCLLIKNQSKHGITVYSGYELDELQTQKNKNQILSMIDILITGRYIDKQRNIQLQWVGCENKKVLFLTDFYQQKQNEKANYCEIHIDSNGKVLIMGFPHDEITNLYEINYD